MVGAASLNARSEPPKRRARSRRVWLALNLPESVRRHEFIADPRLLSSYPHTAMRKLVWPNVFLEILVGVESRASFEHHYIQPAVGEHFCGGSATSSGADDADVVHLLCRIQLEHQFSPEMICALESKPHHST